MHIYILRVNMEKTDDEWLGGQQRRYIRISEVTGKDLNQVESFCYLRSVIRQEGGCEEDVRNSNSAWAKWCDASAAVCDKRMPVKLKRKIYMTVVRPVLIYGAEIWAICNNEERILERTKMRMLRWIAGISMTERRCNKDIRKGDGKGMDA